MVEAGRGVGLEQQGRSGNALRNVLVRGPCLGRSRRNRQFFGKSLHEVIENQDPLDDGNFHGGNI